MPRTDLAFYLCEHGLQDDCNKVAAVPSLLITVQIRRTPSGIAETSFTNVLLVSGEFGGNAYNFIVPIWASCMHFPPGALRLTMYIPRCLG